MPSHNQSATLRPRENMTNKQNENGLGETLTNKEDGMTPLSHQGGRVFQIHVKGHLNDNWSAWLDGLDVELLDNGETIFSGPIPDQAALMGILNKLNRLNLTLLSVCQVSEKNKEKKMNNGQKLNRRFEVIAWGAFFIWWGVTELIPSL